MKRLVCLLLVFSALFVSAMAQEAPEPLYRARLSHDAVLRRQPATNGDSITLIPSYAWVDVYAYARSGEYSLCGYEGETGYIWTDYLYELWQLGDEPLPGMVYMTGIAAVTKACHIGELDFESDDLYSGNDLQPGDMIAAMDASGTVRFRRQILSLPEGTFAYTPFAPVEEARPGEVIYACTTYYNDDSGGELAEERRHNIELAVQRVNGMVLQPGKQFSFNKLCAPYAGLNGYRIAPIIGASGYGYGGGVCQVSTVIFQAALGLNLQLDQWQVHQMTGVKYAPVNFDSAVGGGLDLAFTNSLPYAIRLEVKTQRGAMTALLYRAE